MNVEESIEALLDLYEHNTAAMRHREIENFVDRMNLADTASEVADAVTFNFRILHKYGKDAFLDWVRNSFSKEFWEVSGVLINPTLIPKRFSEGVIVVADGSVQTKQTVDMPVDYYGDVDLIVDKGRAWIADTKNLVKAKDSATVEAHGRTNIVAEGFSVLTLNDRARASIKDDVEVDTFDHAFVESVGGETRITTFGQSGVLVSGGSADVVMYNSSRGAFLGEDGNENQVKVDVESKGVVYVGPNLDKDLEINQTDGVLRGKDLAIAPEEMIDFILPEHKDNSIQFGGAIEIPLALDKLKKDLEAFFAADKFDYLRFDLHEAKDERRVCELVARELPSLMEQGLDGDFLRSHFTQDTLEKNRIYLDRYGFDWVPEDTHNKPSYFFGDQLVDQQLFLGPVFAYENTLLRGKGDNQVILNDSARAICDNSGKVFANDQSQAIALNKTDVRANDKAKVSLLNQSTGNATDHAYVKAYDESLVAGFKHCKAELYGKSTMIANDDNQVLLLGTNKITVLGRTEVAFANYEGADRAEIYLKSDNMAIVVGLPSSEEVKQYKTAMRSDEQEVKRTAGLGR